MGREAPMRRLSSSSEPMPVSPAHSTRLLRCICADYAQPVHPRREIAAVQPEESRTGALAGGASSSSEDESATCANGSTRPSASSQ